MTLRKYRVKRDREISGTLFAKAGDIVYDCKGWDYGLANDDNRFFGGEHISVTTKSDGDYPTFTILKNDLEEIP